MSAPATASAPVATTLAALPTRRLQDWPIRLEALLQARMGAPFEWGARDCCLWAADAVLAITGHDPAADIRGTYADEAEALAMVRRLHGIKTAFRQRLGPATTTALAHVGDVGLVLQAESPAAAVYVGGSWLAQGPEGLVPVDEAGVFAVWRCTACPQP